MNDLSRWGLVVGGAALLLVSTLLLGITSFSKLSMVWIFGIILGLSLIVGAMILTFKGNPPPSPQPTPFTHVNTPTPVTPVTPYSLYPSLPVGGKMGSATGNAKSIAMAQNGNRLFIATDTDSIDIYGKGASTGQWQLETTLAQLTTPYCHLVTDTTGSTLVIAVPEVSAGLSNGVVKVLELSDPLLMTWTVVSETNAPHNTSVYGYSIAMSNDGYLLAVGDSEYNSGIGRVTIMTEEADSSRAISQQIDSSGVESQFGSGLSLSGDGQFLSVYSRNGTSNQGILRIYRRVAGIFTIQQTLTEDPLSISGGEYRFGYRSVMNKAGDVLITTTGVLPSSSYTPYNAPPYIGKIYVYRRFGSTWSREWVHVPAVSGMTKVTAGGTDYSNVLAINTLGTVFAVTLAGDASDRGTVVCFRKEGTNWIRRSSLFGTDASTATAGFGYEIALAGTGTVLSMIDMTEMKLWSFRSN